MKHKIKVSSGHLTRGFNLNLPATNPAKLSARNKQAAEFDRIVKESKPIELHWKRAES